MFDRSKVPAICLAISLAMFAAACGGKKGAPVPPPPPPVPGGNGGAVTPPPTTVTPPAPVVAQFTAEPTNIQIGQSSTLRWQVTGDVSSATIDQTIGTVQNTGSRRVFPSQPTTYTLTATGAGGATTATVTVNVTQAPGPPERPVPAIRTAPTGGSLPERVASNVQDIYFDYDQSEVRSDAQSILTQDAAALKSVLADFPNAIIMVEGHCDERGSAEYNLGLGDRRASSVRDYLQQLGVPADRIRTISYGKERPQCTDADEGCYQKNRRVHFSPGQ